jgi:plasmid maintenance system antidote protein VapI
MRTLKEKLKAVLDAHGHTQNDLAELLGISYQSVSIKMNGRSDFTKNEIGRIVHTYGLTPEETYDIFFSLENMID